MSLKGRVTGIGECVSEREGLAGEILLSVVYSARTQAEARNPILEPPSAIFQDILAGCSVESRISKELEKKLLCQQINSPDVCVMLRAGPV